MRKFIFVIASIFIVLACGASSSPEAIGSAGMEATGSVTLVNGLSPFVPADLTSSTTIIPTRIMPGGTALGILAVLDANRVNKLASLGGGFRITSLVGTGLVQTHDTSLCGWVSYDAEVGGPVAFPPNPRPTGVSAFISADLTASTVIDATHSTSTGGCLGSFLTALPQDRQNVPASQGGGFRITSQDPAGHTRTCDTSSFRWAAH